jgi:hypothetical protein
MLAVGAELRRSTATLAIVETLWLADDPAGILRPSHAQAYDAPGLPNPHARR